MHTSIIKFDYNGNVIPFEKGSDVMVNLTAMAKAYPDKNLSTIVNSQEISDYCTSLSKLKNFSYKNKVNCFTKKNNLQTVDKNLK